MPAARRGAITAATLALTLSLAACGASTSSTGADSEPTAPVPTPSSPGSTPSDALTSPSALPQGIVTSSTFVVGDLVACRVTDIKPLLVLLDASGRRGVIRGAAYEKVKVGDRVVVQITKTDGRFEASLVHVSSRS